MALLKYVRYINKHKQTEKENEFVLPTKVSAFSHEELKEVNNRVSKVMQSKSSQAQGHVNYNKYTPDQKAMIGQYAAENGPTRAANHFTKILNMKVPEPTARRLKKEYLVRLNEVYTKQKQSLSTSANNSESSQIIKKLPTKVQGRPLFLDEKLDQAVQEYIINSRKVGGSVNSIIVLAAANGTIVAKDRNLLMKHGGHLVLTKAWAKSLLGQIGYVKRNCSNAGKVTF